MTTPEALLAGPVLAGLRGRDFLLADDLSVTEQAAVLELAAALKLRRQAALSSGRTDMMDHLGGRSVAIVFEKPSLRTRVSFELAVHELGGHAVKIDDVEIGLGKRETVGDIGAVLSGFVQGIVLRTFGHEKLVELAAASGVPVINALCDLEHPCQSLADLQTMAEEFGDIAGRTLAYVGDGNNVAHSLLVAGANAGVHVVVAHPVGYAPDAAVVARAQSIAATTGGSATTTTDPVAGVTGADAVYTDVWTSMGQEAESAARLAAFQGFQVDAPLMAHAADGAILLHCLPAHRGEEVSAEIIDGPASRVFAQAENRLHAQKALLAALLAGPLT